MEAAEDVWLIVDDDFRQVGRGQAPRRRFERGGRMAEVSGRGGNQTWNCFICGKEGHFTIPFPKKNKLMVVPVE